MTRRAVWFGIAVVVLCTLVLGLLAASAADSPREHHKKNPDVRPIVKVTIKVYINGVQNDAEVKLWKPDLSSPPCYDISCPGGNAVVYIAAGQYKAEVVGWSGYDDVTITMPGTITLQRPL